MPPSCWACRKPLTVTGLGTARKLLERSYRTLGARNQAEAISKMMGRNQDERRLDDSPDYTHSASQRIAQRRSSQLSGEIG